MAQSFDDFSSGISDHTRSDLIVASEAERRDVGDSDSNPSITNGPDSPDINKLANASASN
jgi:hypothetical protein